jgi:hypothetical protein
MLFVGMDRQFSEWLSLCHLAGTVRTIAHREWFVVAYTMMSDSIFMLVDPMAVAMVAFDVNECR